MYKHLCACEVAESRWEFLSGWTLASLISCALRGIIQQTADVIVHVLTPVHWEGSVWLSLESKGILLPLPAYVADLHISKVLLPLEGEKKLSF